MARWGKNIVVPLESLIKEKENTNRPTAARSAGTVGKWGKMGFTSTRTYPIKASLPTLSPIQQQKQQQQSSNVVGGERDSGEPPQQPKPKKFFKSRNSTTDIIRTQIIQHLPRAPPSPVREVPPTSIPTLPPPSSHPSRFHKESNIKIKTGKPRTAERKKSASNEKTVVVKAKKKKEEKKLKPEAPPSRVISRHRKVVNYAEDDDERSQTPLRDVTVPKPYHSETGNEIGQIGPNFSKETKLDPLYPKIPDATNNSSIESPTSATGVPIKNADHPPIVLRISKGTSRLISTDSEELPNSPNREPIVPEQTVTNEKPSITENNLLEKASLPEREIEHCVNSEAQKTSVEQNHKPESLKIVIKADVLKSAFVAEKPHHKKGKNKKHKNMGKNVEKEFKTPSPQTPIVENFDATKILTSPSEKDFDSQSSILGSVSSKGINRFPNVINDETCVIRSRGSSDITSDLETSQHSSLVAPPSDIESRLESMMDGDDDEQLVSNTRKSTIEEMLKIRDEPLKEDILDVLTGKLEEDEKQINDAYDSVPEKRNQNVQNLETRNKTIENVKELDDQQYIKSPKESENKEVKVPIKKTEKRVTRSRGGGGRGGVTAVAATQKVQPKLPDKEIPVVTSRITRSNNNNGNLRTKPPVRSYGSRKKRGQKVADKSNLETISETPSIEEVDSSLALNMQDLPNSVLDAAPNNNSSVNIKNDTSLPVETENKLNVEKEYKIKNKFKRSWYEREAKKINYEEEEDEDEEPLTKRSSHYDSREDLIEENRPNNKTVNNNNENMETTNGSSLNEDEKRSVKLVISKKKGSIFKSRALVADQGDANKKRHIYKHTWDDEDNKKVTEVLNESPSKTENATVFDEFNVAESTSKLTRFTRQVVTKMETENVTGVRVDKKAKEYYTVVRNVKTAHQIQEIGEYQEMDDDVEYILDALQPHNPVPTRCLSALQLATKCMTPAFRMHVRAHGTVTKFFRALRDAKNDLNLGLCTAAIMFVLSQDTLNMDLDRDTLELMLNLLKVDASKVTDDNSQINYERNKQKAREMCEELKGQGKATHLNLEAISVGTLAMETLLSLTSKRAGEWFKEELRELGGLEHIIKTICDCFDQISDYVVSWTEYLLDQLRTIERCLRVLENVSQENERNQEYVLTYSNGHAVNTLFKLYKLCDSEIALYPTLDSTPKENPGVVIREALVPTLKVLINLTHPFDNRAIGSKILGQREGIYDTSFHILLQAPNYIPERCIFELSILVLLLLINLTMHTIENRALIMKSHAPSDFGNQFDKIPAIKALIEYFYRCEEQARLAEKNTDAILENPDKTKKKPQSQEEVDETVTKLLQKAGHHMEHTMQASYAGILIGHLISENEENEKVIRSYLRENSFKEIVSILEKYYNFMNLTASSEAFIVSHIKSTKKLIDYFKKCDSHSNENISTAGGFPSGTMKNERTAEIASASTSSISTRSTPRVYKTYSQR